MKIKFWPPLFAFIKEFLKNTNENMPLDHFCSQLRQDGQIDLPSSPDCHIFIAISEIVATIRFSSNPFEILFGGSLHIVDTI